MEQIAEQHSRCAAHGEYVSKTFRLLGRSITTECPKCMEAEDRNRVEKQMRDNHSRIASEKRKQDAAALGLTGFGSRYSGVNFQSYGITEIEPKAKRAQMLALETCKRYADQFKRLSRTGHGLVLHGMPGTGKTMLAAAICNQIHQAGKSYQYTEGGQIAAAVAKLKKEMRYDDIETMFCKPDLLVIDEIGVDPLNTREASALWAVMQSRYKNMQPVILVANYDKPAIEDYLGSRLFDRVEENSSFVAFEWGSYRRRKSA